MKPVVQLERTGCGIASVAALTGVSYAQAKRMANRIGILADDSKLWSETSYVRRLLTEYGFGRQELKCLSPHGRPCRILRCSPSNGTKNGIARPGIGWCFGVGLAGRSCSIRSATFATMCGPTSVASSRNGSFL